MATENHSISYLSRYLQEGPVRPAVSFDADDGLFFQWLGYTQKTALFWELATIRWSRPSYPVSRNEVPVRLTHLFEYKKVQDFCSQN